MSRRFRELGDADVPSPDSLEETLFSEERETMQARLAEDLAALTGLSDEQNLIIRMSTQDGLTAREIGKAMQLCPRKIYSKRSQALGKLRATMTAAGWVSSEVEALMEWKGFDLNVA